MLVSRGWLCRRDGGGHVQQDHGVIVGGARFGDLGVFKAVGMTPRQTIIMVICWVIAPAVIAAAIALPAGLTIQEHLVRQLTSGSLLERPVQATTFPGGEPAPPRCPADLRGAEAVSYTHLTLPTIYSV